MIRWAGGLAVLLGDLRATSVGVNHGEQAAWLARVLQPGVPVTVR